MGISLSSTDKIFDFSISEYFATPPAANPLRTAHLTTTLSHRPQQVGTEIQRALSQILMEEMPFERFGLVTITEVMVTPGLESARIYVSSLKDNHDVVENLNQRAGKLSSELRKKIQLRKMPQLIFLYDTTAEKEERLNKLFGENK
jgi:ribosome-binding factor A